MGFTPQQVDGMSLFQFLSCRDGFLLAKGEKRRGPVMSDAEFDDLVMRKG